MKLIGTMIVINLPHAFESFMTVHLASDTAGAVLAMGCGGHETTV